MPQRSDLVVVAGRGSELAVYLDVLRDWSSLGLVADFLAIDTEAEGGTKGAPCLVVSGGRQRPALLQPELARRPVTGSAHVVLLSHVGETFSTVGAERALALRHEVRDALPGAQVTGIQLIGVAREADDEAVPESQLAWLGVHNVVLAPENAHSPRSGVAPIVGGPANPVTHTHLAAGLCSAAGLWTADRRTPFQGEPDAGGERLVALRTYTRHLGARSVQSQLAEQVMDLQRGYPVPLDDGLPAVRLEDEAGAASRMADQLLAKHDYLGAGQRRQPATTQPDPVGFVAASGMMLRFFGQALTGSPRAFLGSLVDAAPQGVASTQALAFGGEFAYVVTDRGIRGIRQDGSVASAEELDADLGRLLGQLGGPASPGQQDLSGLWTDFVHGGLTLLDGARRSDALDPIRVGSGLGVVTSPQLVVPQEAFTLNPDLSGYAQTEQVTPYDVDGARRTHDVLGDQAAEHPRAASQLAQEQARLRERFAHLQKTYAGRVGELLAGELRKTRAEVVAYADELSGARSRQEVPGDVLATQSTLARTLVTLAGAAGLVVLLLAAVALLGPLSWLVVLLLAVVLGGGWVVAATLVFQREQRGLFELLHRREGAGSLQGAVRANLVDALGDLRRQQRAYRQFLDWAQALGTFVHAPWGRHEVRADHDVVLGAGYPHNHRFGTAVADAASVELVAARLRPHLFPVGWTSLPWQAFLADQPTIGSDTHFLQDEPGLVFTDRAVSKRSILSQWSEAVAGREWTGGYAQLVEQLQLSLRQDVDAYRQTLLGSVRTLTDQGEPSTETYEQFMVGLLGEPREGSFSRRLFADVPETREPWAVGEALVTDTVDDFSSSVVLTQVSVGFTPRDLAFVAGDVSLPEEPVPSEQAPQV